MKNKSSNNLLSNLLLLKSAKGHMKLHMCAYNYLVEKGLIEEYLKWFIEKYSEIEVIRGK